MKKKLSKSNDKDRIKWPIHKNTIQFIEGDFFLKFCIYIAEQGRI